MKIAARKDGDQGKVWQQVAEVQRKLSHNLNQDVASAASQTSLELSLENKTLQQAVEAYQKSLAGTIQDKPDVIGFVFAINGELNSAEVYGASALFRAAWPKLLRNAAVEAVAEKTDGQASADLDESEVRALFQQTESAEGREQEVSDRVSTVMNECDEGLLFETRDRERNGAWVRRSYIAY